MQLALAVLGRDGLPLGKGQGAAALAEKVADELPFGQRKRQAAALRARQAARRRGQEPQRRRGRFGRRLGQAWPGQGEVAPHGAQDGQQLHARVGAEHLDFHVRLVGGLAGFGRDVDQAGQRVAVERGRARRVGQHHGVLARAQQRMHFLRTGADVDAEAGAHQLVRDFVIAAGLPEQDGDFWRVGFYHCG
ncbi:MAG: hypothetical protein BGO71_21360 [Burkholderiales bacterium 67-32]|nr:MAG: hypothetical protein BGO71_21360 [Burkholderiales bacterium 67-32]